MSVAVWFDLDGTLVEMTEAYDDVIRAALAPHVADPGALAEAYDRAFVDRFLACEPEPYSSAMAVACRDCGVDADPETLTGSLRDREVAATDVPADVRPCLDRLSDRRLGVITNGVPAWQRAKLAEHDLLGRFEAVVASYAVGAHKPDPAPFDRARDLLPADRHLMVGDSEDADVDGARAAGFEAVHLDRDRGGTSGTDGTPDVDGERPPRIASLADLPPLVEDL